MTNNSTIWENTCGCSDKYRCATLLYLLSMLSHAYNIVIDGGVGSPIHRKYAVDGLNANDKEVLQCWLQLCNFLVQPLTPHIWSYTLQWVIHTPV